MFKKTRKIPFIILGTIILSGGIVFAGSITPSSYLLPTTHTLNDIYQKLTNNSYTAEIADSFSFPTGEATSTMYSLEDIWNVIPTISSSSIISSATILGVTGSYVVSNLTPNKVASGTSYGNGLVGTMLGANNLTWSENLGPMTWASSTAYCSYYGSRTEWRLPTVNELLSAINYQKLGSTDLSLTPGDFIAVDSTSYWTLIEGTDIASDIANKAVSKAKVATIFSGDGVLIDDYAVMTSLKTSAKNFRCVKNNY